MRALMMLFGFKGGIALLMLAMMFPLGVAMGAAATGGVPHLDAQEHYVTAEEVGDEKYQPWYRTWLERHTPDFIDNGGEMDPTVRAFMVDAINQFLEVAFAIANAGISFGYANRGWIDPQWAARSGVGLFFVGIAGYALSMWRVARREIA